MAKRPIAGLTFAVALIASLGYRAAVAQQGADGQPLSPRESIGKDGCGTGPDRLRQLGLRPRTVIPGGQGVSYRQEPAVVTSDYAGRVTLREFTVAGDVPTVRFQLDDDGSEIETWN